MLGEDLYWAERLMNDSVRQAQQEAEASRLGQESKAGAQSWLAGMVSRLFRQSGHSLQRLGTWLELQGVPGKAARADQMRATS